MPFVMAAVGLLAWTIVFIMLVYFSLCLLYKYISGVLSKCAKVLTVLGLGRHGLPSFETMRLIFSTSS